MVTPRRHPESGYPLIPEQRVAAERNEGPLIVIGGPLTGKTRSLVARVAYLLEGGAQPEEITVLTARSENVANLVRMVAGHPTVSSYGDRIRLYTVDQYANLILRSGGAKELGVFPRYSIWDAAQAEQVTACALEVAGRFGIKAHDVRLALDWHWQNMRRCPDDPKSPAQDDRWRDIVSTYVREKESQRALDVPDLSDLAFRAIERVRRDDPIWRLKEWSHLLLDRIEECNGQQLALVDLMVDVDGTLMMTSDPNQGPAEYSLELLIQFWESRYPKLDVFWLTQAPVGSGILHDAATDLQQAESMTGLDKDGREYVRSPGPKPELVMVDGTFRNMVRHCIADIKELIDGGVNESDIAILYRRPGVMDRMRTGLAHLGIPYRVMGYPAPRHPTDAEYVVAMLTKMVNPWDLAAFAIAGGVGHPNQTGRLSPRTCESLLRVARRDGVDLIEAARTYLLSGETRDVEDLERLIQRWEALREAAEHRNTNPAGLLAYAETLVEAVGHSEVFSGLSKRNENTAWLREALFDSPTVDGNDVEGHLVRFLDSISPALGHTREPDSDRGLTISTIAAARGRHWPVVMILDVSDQTIPGNVHGDRKALELEQRIFFTGLTRATRQLHLYCVADTGQGNDSTPSRFLEPVSHRLECRWAGGAESAHYAVAPANQHVGFTPKRFG